MIQSSDSVMAEKIQSTIVNTIPLWKSQMVIAIGVEHANSRCAPARSDGNDQSAAQKECRCPQDRYDRDREGIRERLWISRPSHTNEMLISTMDEVLTIQSEGETEEDRSRGERGFGIESQLREKLPGFS